MRRTITAYTILVFSLNLAIGQECPIINTNGDFEEMIYVPGGEPTIGITTGQIDSWSASHGTVDYISPDWNWYDLQGVSSIAGHMCYGNRDAHDHSEGMYTPVKIYGHDDLLYTLSLEYATVCEAPNNGFLNVALNNNLSETGHNWFQYPTPDVFPEVFQDIQAVDRFELKPEANFNGGDLFRYEVSFVPSSNYSQMWLFTEYQYPQEDFINCGLIIDNVKVTATTSALNSILYAELSAGKYEFKPQYSRNLNVTNYEWSVDGQSVEGENKMSQTLEEGVYTICLDIVDDRGACGSACQELTVGQSSNNNDSAESICTYSSCLDLGGLPNIMSLDFLDKHGDVVTIDDNTAGFYFPYCIGTSSMCAGGSTELDLFIEDLNNYFQSLGIVGVNVRSGYSEDASDLECRSMAITIESIDIVPLSISLDDFLVDNIQLTVIDFDYNPDNCSGGLDDDDQGILYAVSTSTTLAADGENRVMKGERNPGINRSQGEAESINEELTNDEIGLFYGGIYTIAGNKIMGIEQHQLGDNIEVDQLPVGMYVMKLSSRKEDLTKVFFKGE